MLETLSRDAYERECTRGDLTRFRYTPNSRGFIFLQICAGLLFIIAFAVYMSTGFAERYWILLSGLLTLGGVALIGIVSYWTYFARTSEVAFDPDHLYVVRMHAPVRVPWRALTAEAAGFADEHDDGNHGVLNMRLDGKRVQLVLFNAFVVVEDFPSFLVELLTQIKRNRAAAAEAAAEAATVDDEPGTGQAATAADGPA